MMHSPQIKDALSLSARALIALLFIPSGVAKLLGFAGATTYIASKGVPFPAIAAAIAVIVEVGFGLLLLSGFQTKWAALVIAGFTLVVTLVFHNYWAVAPDVFTVQRLFFFKNLAIVGGLMAIVAMGAGSWSIDGRRVSR